MKADNVGGVSRADAARALIRARDAYVAAQIAMADAKKLYVDAETAYIDASSADALEPNLAVNGVVILLVDDWYDLKAGERVTFHSVEVVS